MRKPILVMSTCNVQLMVNGHNGGIGVLAQLPVVEEHNIVKEFVKHLDSVVYSVQVNL